jgi:catechol 2,3-dioxygenase-like lactoylglutathione lyase family enzyme
MKIKQLNLYSSKIEALKEFYLDVLGFDLIEAERNRFSFQVGETKIEFKETLEEAYYHFAFNIPMNQAKDAINWLKAKDINILKYKGAEIVDFANWEAEALYFYDPAGNIVEFIARRPLAVASNESFSASSILSVSEIGLPLLDVGRILHLLEELADLPVYSGGPGVFCAMGDPEGLFIMVDQAKKDWIPENDPAIPFPLQVHFEQQEQMFILDYNSQRLKITKDK